MNSHRLTTDRTRFVLLCAITALAVSASALVGWLLEIELLKSALPGFPAMRPTSGLAFVAASFGLFFYSGVKGGIRLYYPIIAGAIVVGLGLPTLIDHYAGLALPIESPGLGAGALDTANFVGGPIPRHSAMNFIGLGLAIVLIGGNRVQRSLSEVLSALTFLSSFFGLLGYIYQAEEMNGVTRYNSMAVNSIALFMVCAAGLLAANKDSRTVGLLTSGTLGGTAARTLLPAVILVPTIIHWLRNAGQEHLFFSGGFGTALSIMVSVVLMLGIVLVLGVALDNLDKKRRRVEAELVEKESQYREVYDYSQGLICVHDVAGTILSVNPAVERALGFSNSEIVGHHLAEFFPPEMRAAMNAFLREIESTGLSNGLMTLVTRDGRELVWRYHSILVSNPSKAPYVIGHAQDVTELIEAQKQLKNLSLTDDLTGLYNRRGFLAMAEQQIKLERHQRTARGLTLMFADMDGLKRINDVYGHEAGSDAIIALAGIIKDSLRTADLVGRWGGDEFVIMTIGSRNEDANAMTHRILEKIAEYNGRSGKPYQLSCSIGLAPIRLDGGHPFEAIIAEADAAMYAEKQRRRAGRNSVSVPVSEILDSTSAIH